MSELEFDYVVVGGGTAGAIVARRLAELYSGSVCLLEAGPSDEHDERVLDLRVCEDLLGSDLDYNYAIQPQKHSRSDIRHNRARVLGGCSSHNAAACFKTPTSDLENWQRLGASGWGPEDCNQFFDRVFRRVHMEYPDPVNSCGIAFLEAAQQAGYPLKVLGQDDVEECVGWFLLHKEGRRRTSSSTAYLHPLDRLPTNLEVLTGVRALKLLIDESLRATAVETTRGLVLARREIVVSCGAIDSPRLLMLSGIGSAEHLRSVGIKPVVDLPGVGDHLLDHPEVAVNWESTMTVPSESSQFWECALFAKTRVGVNAPDLQAVFATVPYDNATRTCGFPTVDRDRGFAFAPHVTRSVVEGRIRLHSADPYDDPEIDPRYYSDDGSDERILIAGIRIARHLATMPALSTWIRRELAPGPELQTDGQLGDYVRSTTCTSHHLAGTCRMGALEDPRAVVDPLLRVRGLQGLRIVDSSVFPSDVGVNPVVTVMMIAEKAAQIIVAEENMKPTSLRLITPVSI